MKIKTILVVFVLFISFTHLVYSKPKYADDVRLLRQHNAYMRSHKAFDFWKLMPFYSGQPGDCGCSTSFLMILNALMTQRKLSSDDALISSKSILEKVKPEGFDLRKRVESKRGVDLKEYQQMFQAAFKAFDLSPQKIEIVVVEKNDAATRKRVHADLVANEKSDNNFILANFNQGVLTGDADAGHLSPVGAFDAKTGKVLILDVDREWYEPYWVTEEKFVQSMATFDSDAGSFRGYVKVGNF